MLRSKSRLPITERLQSLQDRAKLSEKEIGHWLGVPARTVGSWIREVRTPQWTWHDQISRKLDFLDKELARKRPRFPIPMDVKQYDRLSYVKSVRTDYPAG